MKRYRSLKSADEALKLLREKISKTEEGGAKPLKLLQHKQQKQQKKRTRKQQKPLEEPRVQQKSLEELRDDRAAVESIINSQIEKDKRNKYLNTTPKLQILKKEDEEPLPTIPSLSTQDTQNKEEDLKKTEEQTRAEKRVEELQRAKNVMDEMERDPGNKEVVTVEKYDTLSDGDLQKLIEKRDQQELAPSTALAEYLKKEKKGKVTSSDIMRLSLSDLTNLLRKESETEPEETKTPRPTPPPSPRIPTRTPPSVVVQVLPPKPNEGVNIKMNLTYPTGYSYEERCASTINDKLREIIDTLKGDIERLLSQGKLNVSFFEGHLKTLNEVKEIIISNMHEFERVFNELALPYQQKSG